MVDIDFLPDWYRRTRRRRRQAALQAWLTLAIALGVGAWSVLAARNVASAETVLRDTEHDLDQTRGQLRQRGDLEQLRAQLKVRETIDARLGTNVELSRVLRLIDAALPGEVAILETEIDTVVRQRPAPERGTGLGRPLDVPVDHVLVVTIKGVSPTNVEVANFMEALQATKLCLPVRLAYARDRIDSGRVMCEFALDFTLDLSVPGE